MALQLVGAARNEPIANITNNNINNSTTILSNNKTYIIGVIGVIGIFYAFSYNKNISMFGKKSLF
jgi:hypothetical protein